MLRALVILTLLLSGCCHYDKATSTLYGLGKYKDKEVEMETKSPIENIVNLSGIGGL